MNIKNTAAILMAGVSLALFADVSVMDVKFKPRTPWTGLVDIEYTIACANPQDEVYVHPVAYDGDRRMTLFLNCLTGDGVTNTVKAGTHKMTWDSITDYGVFASANFQIKIYAGKRLPKYVKIDLSSGPESDEYPISMSIDGPDLSKDDCRTTELWLRLVPPGEFWMGSPAGELGRSDNEVLHHVTLTKPFYIGVFEVTQKQYELVMGENPSYFKETDNCPLRPIENVVFNGQISGFLSRLRTRTRILSFELPTEAKWEYACRAGVSVALYNGYNLPNVDYCSMLNEIARNFANGWGEYGQDESNERFGTTKVGCYKSNRLGLYDMLGNVWEFCVDGAYYSPGVIDVVDPIFTQYEHSRSGVFEARVIRGGAYDSKAKDCRVAVRNSKTVYAGSYGGGNYSSGKNCGFRLCAGVDL